MAVTNYSPYANVRFLPVTVFYYACVHQQLFIMPILKSLCYTAALGCKRINSYKELEKVLQEVNKPREKICRDLNIAPYTCNTQNLQLHEVAYEYEQQNPIMCWEKIIMHLCEDFAHVKLAYQLAQRYSILNAHTTYCKT